MESPSQVFAAVLPAHGTKKEQALEVRTVSTLTSDNQLREVQVTGTAEVRCKADRARVWVSVENRKETINEVTSSVLRRFEYILQTIRQHGIRDEDTSVRRLLRRDDDMYHMDAEVQVTFSDFEKMEQICSILLEKLDRSVRVGIPQFYHSTECLHQMRQQACVLAVENAQLKARKVSQLLGQSLGSPLLVREEKMKESRSDDEEGGAGYFLSIPTITASSRVSVSFSLRDRSRKKD
ncbi:interleukin-1 receptor-associated kinase 1-binding protein 1 homolog [Pholidichthys leucotaenia]